MNHDDKDFRSTGRVDQYRMELESLSREELIERLLRAEGKLAEETLAANLQPTATRSFDVDWTPQAYVRLPAGGAGDALAAWRIALISIDLTHPIIGIEAGGDVVIGRSSAEFAPDLDLTEYNAAGYGVSRQHAVLRASPDGIQLADMGSTNGTQVNGEKLMPHSFCPLVDKDRIRFGNLEFQFRLATDPD